LNSGSTRNLGPETNSVSWIFDTQTKELSASAVVADGEIVINNWGGVFCLDEEGETIWKNEDVLGGFSPAIATNSVFVGGKDGFLYSLNLTSGNTRWRTKITDHPGISGVTSAPALDKGRIYVGSFNFSGGAGALLCLDAKSGSILWESSTASSIYFSSPAIAEDKVFIGTMGLYNSSTLQWEAPYGMYCFSKKSGGLIWNFSVDGSVGSAPAIADEKLLFTSKDGFLYCLNVEDGELLWKNEIGSSVSSPAVSQGKIYVGSGEMNKEGMFYSLDLNGNVLWEFEPNGAVQSSPAVAGEFVYFATNVKDGTIYCLNKENGELKWQYKPTPEEYIISSPAVSDNKMYIASDNGRLYCFGGDSPNFAVNQTTDAHIVHLGEDVIFHHKNIENKLIITAFGENSVTLQIDTMDDPIEVSKGRITTVDTDSDGQRDLAISIAQVNTTSQTASLSLDLFTEPPVEEDERVPLAILIALIIIIFLIIVGIAANLKRKVK
jgi:outer membrane protein assembly factor BamB